MHRVFSHDAHEWIEPLAILDDVYELPRGCQRGYVQNFKEAAWRACEQCR
jgi:hypothetical protein